MASEFRIYVTLRLSKTRLRFHRNTTLSGTLAVEFAGGLHPPLEQNMDREFEAFKHARRMLVLIASIVSSHRISGWLEGGAVVGVVTTIGFLAASVLSRLEQRARAARRSSGG